MVKKRFDTNIQLYNCTYSYQRLADRTISPKQFNDYCIKYLFQDTDQVLAIKSDLVLHNIYYNEFNYTMFYDRPNLIRSSFYGTYSGITFYMPVTFFRPKAAAASATAPPTGQSAAPSQPAAAVHSSDTYGAEGEYIYYGETPIK